MPNPNFRLRSRCSAYITKLPIASPSTDCINRPHGIVPVCLIPAPIEKSTKSSAREKIPDRYRATLIAKKKLQSYEDIGELAEAKTVLCFFHRGFHYIAADVCVISDSTAYKKISGPF